MPDPIPHFQTLHIPDNSTIIVGLSGGPDSICLLYQLHAIASQRNLKLIAAHLDHEWQESSKIAVQLCTTTCQNLQILLIVQTRSQLGYAPTWNGSQEEIGRLMRRHFFAQVAAQHQAVAIALAHHQQDQQETFFIRLLRGSSLQGLVCMQEQDGLYIRPMLSCKKSEILDYLHTNNIFYYTDPTNSSDIYLRNKIRNHVIPALQQTDQRFEQKLQSTMQQLTQVDDFLEQQVQQILQTHLTDAGMSIPFFVSCHLVIQQRILLHMIIQAQVTFSPSQNLFKEIVRFLERSNSSAHTIYSSWKIKKNKNCFVIEKIKKIEKTL